MPDLTWEGGDFNFFHGLMFTYKWRWLCACSFDFSHGSLNFSDLVLYMQRLNPLFPSLLVLCSLIDDNNEIDKIKLVLSDIHYN